MSICNYTYSRGEPGGRCFYLYILAVRTPFDIRYTVATETTASVSAWGTMSVTHFEEQALGNVQCSCLVSTIYVGSAGTSDGDVVFRRYR